MFHLDHRRMSGILQWLVRSKANGVTAAEGIMSVWRAFKSKLALKQRREHTLVGRLFR